MSFKQEATKLLIHYEPPDPRVEKINCLLVSVLGIKSARRYYKMHDPIRKSFLTKINRRPRLTGFSERRATTSKPVLFLPVTQKLA